MGPAQPREGQGQGEGARCGRACDAWKVEGREGRRAADAVDVGDGLYGRFAGVEGELELAAESETGECRRRAQSYVE